MNTLIFLTTDTLSLGILEFPNIITIVLHLSKVVLVMMILLGLLSIVGVMSCWKTYGSFVSVPGDIIDFELLDISNSGDRVRRPVVAYIVDGKRHIMKGKETTDKPKQIRMKGVNVFYNIYNPEEAYEESELFLGLAISNVCLMLIIIFSFVLCTIKYITGAF